VRRMSPLMEENMLFGSGAEATTELYVAAAYFRALRTDSARELTTAYTAKHGPDAPALNNMAESCFEGLMALAGLLRRAQSLAPTDLSAIGDTVGYDGPRGPMQIRGGNVRQHVYLAKASDLGFEVLQRLRRTAASLRIHPRTQSVDTSIYMVHFQIKGVLHGSVPVPLPTRARDH